MKKVWFGLCSIAGLAFATTTFASPTCSTGQMDASTLASCTVGVEDFSNFAFSAAGYTGTATVQIEAATDPTVEPYIMTLRFSSPIQTAFTFSFTATTNSPDFQNASVVQQMLAGNTPNFASVDGTYNGVTMHTDGTSVGAYTVQGAILPSPVLNVALSGTGASPAPPPPCTLCGGGPLQKVDLNIYLTNTSAGPGGSVPEPMTLALTGLGLVGVAILRRKSA